MTWIRKVSVCVLAFGLTPIGRSQTAGISRSIDDLVSAALERNGEYLAIQQRLHEAQGLLRQAGVRQILQ